MATIVLTNLRLEINSVNLSAWCKSATLNYEAEIQDETAFGDASRTALAGLTKFSVSAELMQDYASGAVDATLFPLVGAAPFPVKIRGTTAAISSTNVEFQGNGVLASYQPIGGEIGSMHMTSIEITGSGVLVRATS